MDARFSQLENWLQSTLGYKNYHIAPASADASFRRYFRVTRGSESVIVMDAPPEREDCAKFVRVARRFAEAGINVPHVLAENLNDGFLLLSDFGNRQYLSELTPETVDVLYGDATTSLLRLQSCEIASQPFPLYDRALLERELEIFREWFLDKYLRLVLTARAAQELGNTFAKLVECALEQPRVWVHRDFHSRNLMITEAHSPGVLDFQDAVIGPITYDLASLLRDCYIEWPRGRVDRWAASFFDRAGNLSAYEGVERKQFLRWFDWMGMQRHLKAIGIFARLNARDGKPGYLKDIPRTLGYVIDVAARYPEFTSFGTFLGEDVTRALNNLGFAAVAAR